MAPKEVRRLDFVPYHLADKERDRRRVQVHYYTNTTITTIQEGRGG